MPATHPKNWGLTRTDTRTSAVSALRWVTGTSFPNIRHRPIETPEVLRVAHAVLVLRHLVIAMGLLVEHAQALHTVDAILADLVVLVGPRGQVITAVAERDAHRGNHIGLAAMLRMHLTIQTDLPVRERYLLLVVHGIVDLVDVCQHRIVATAHAGIHVDATLELLTLAVGGKSPDVARQALRLPLRDERAALHGIHHEHELVKREFAAFQVVFNGITLHRTDGHAEFAQRVEVGVDGFTIDRHPQVGKPADNAGHRQAVIVIGLVLQHLHDVEGSELSLSVASHDYPF